MKHAHESRLGTVRTSLLVGTFLTSLWNFSAPAAPATLLYSEDFNNKLTGWTAVKPAAGVWVDGDMLWVFNKLSDSFGEQSNIYTGASAGSTTRIGVSLINDTAPPTSGFVYSARMNSGDDDGFGLIWGYQDENNFYRITFSTQTTRTAPNWPAQGLTVDRMSNGVPVDVFGPDSSFIATRGRPFDVTLAVTNSTLTLTVVDDPLGTPVTYTFNTDVSPVVLPSVPSGKVGIFSWGMSTPVSPANFQSFRAYNLALSPTPLVNANPATLLPGWSFLTPPGGAGRTNAVNETVWGFAYSPTGERGTLINVDDQAPNNSAAATTNFPAPSAVGGDASWSNYVYSARFVLGDNDGFGVLLRYQNPTNFYRIAFRAQASTSGIKQGISVQKDINGVYQQMFASTGIIPPYTLNTKQVFDVYAFIRTNRLQVIAVTAPDTAPVVASSGPIDMDLTAGTVDTGKIGVFSWAQFGDAGTSLRTGTEVDWVQVQQVEQEALLVASPYGSPSPPVGLNDLPVGGSITATVASVVITAPGVRQLSTGWSGAGSVPANGSVNEAVFALNQFSLLTWKWQTQYQLAVSATAGGTAVASAGPWVNATSNVTVTATADPGFMFTGWSGDVLSTTPALALTMTRPYTLTAHFAADSDGDGMPDDWEQQYFGFGNLSQTATDDADGDGRNNVSEYQLGSNPTVAETLVLADGLSSRWINECRDRAIPGWFGVTNFGSGFRGVWEVSNQNRAANSAGPDDFPFITTTNYGTNASFQGPTIVVRSNVWNSAWESTFSLSAEFSVGDNDGDCLYFRYLDRSNWYRVTLCGNDAPGTTRPFTGVSLQKRTNGWFSLVDSNYISGPVGSVYPDPLDTTGFKRLRVTVYGTNDTFEVRVIGWNTFLGTPDWDPTYEVVLTFTDNSLPGGRIGIGPWGQAGFGAWNATNGNPVGAGVLMDNIVLQVDGTNAFVEDWETAPLHSDFPAGWENAYASLPPGGLFGDWHQSAHGTLANFTFQYGTPQTGTAEFPKADGEGPILLAPPITNANFLLEVGIHPLDDGGMGFVYDFQDTNNFARVLFNSQVPVGGDMLRGVNISRKISGVWSNILVGDTSFVYAPGRPFDVSLAANNGSYSMTATLSDSPGTAYHWNWTDQPATADNRVGLAVWDMPDAHFNYLRASSLAAPAPYIPLKITNVTRDGGNVILDIIKPTGSSYHVLRSANVTGPYVTNAVNQTGSQYIEAAPAGDAFYRLQYVP